MSELSRDIINRNLHWREAHPCWVACEKCELELEQEADYSQPCPKCGGTQWRDVTRFVHEDEAPVPEELG